MNTKNIKIEQFNSDDVLPLYIESQGQEGPAYLYLDTRDGDVWLSSKHPANSNTCGQDEHNGHVRRWSIPNNLTVKGINQLLADNYVVARLSAVTAGAEEYYDGSNYRTKLDETADEASAELEKFLSYDYDAGYDALEAWSAHQWLDLCPYRDCVKDGETHEEAAARLAKEAITQGVYLIECDIESALDDKKKRQADDESE